MIFYPTSNDRVRYLQVPKQTEEICSMRESVHNMNTSAHYTRQTHLDKGWIVIWCGNSSNVLNTNLYTHTHKKDNTYIVIVYTYLLHTTILVA